ncbi:MAG: hypothetical protein AB8C13_01620 [Phycisphaerales bacterium]
MTNRPPKPNARRCVVWHHPGVSVHQSLIGALSSRGLRVETSDSGHEVLAIACAVQQQLQESARGLIVVLDRSGRDLEDLSRVIESMDRYAPSGLVWEFDPSANPPLSGFVRTGAERVQAVSQKDDAEIGIKIQFNSSSPKLNPAEGPVLKLSGGQINSVNGSGTTGSGVTGSGVTGSGITGSGIVGPGINPVQTSDVLNQEELSALLKPDEGS